jgi:oxygen-independent coproporphyrinogen-3 oxidase
MIAPRIRNDRKVSQIHYGGGTPNSLPAPVLSELNSLLFNYFEVIPDPEIAIECNPAYLNFPYLDALLSAGFNRFSLGIQDFNNEVLRSVNREPSKIPVDELLAYIRHKNPSAGVNLDFIYGLPGQTTDSFEKTIEKAIAIRPDRLVTFSYAHVPWMKKHQVILEKKGLPSPTEKMDMFLSAWNLLRSSGYKSLGLDHYVLPTDELYKALENHELHRNFQGYCTRRTTGQVYAFGASAISQLEPGYSQNLRDTEYYINVLSNNRLPVEKGYRLTAPEIITREIITELMCNMRLNWENLSERLSLSPEELKATVGYNENAFADFAADGLLEYSPKEITVNDTGALFIRNIVVSLDKNFKKEGVRYSKSV